MKVTNMSRLVRKALLSAVAMLALSLHTPARATVFTDLWWNPAENGWGINLVQQYNSMFATFFVYWKDGSPYWYFTAMKPGATLPSGYARWDGDLYESGSTPLGSPYNPAQFVYRKVGTASFQPSSAYRALISYSIDGLTITKNIERQTFNHIPLGGRYVGGYSVVRSTCPTVAVGNFGPIVLVMTATVNSDGVSGSVTAGVAFDNVAGSCTVAGSYRQYGSVYLFPAIANCPFYGATFAFAFTDISSTDDGIDGNITLTQGSCAVGLNFSAARLP